MRGPWSRKAPQWIRLKPATERDETTASRKAKRIGIAPASEKTKP